MKSTAETARGKRNRPVNGRAGCQPVSRQSQGARLRKLLHFPRPNGRASVRECGCGCVDVCVCVRARTTPATSPFYLLPFLVRTSPPMSPLPSDGQSDSCHDWIPRTRPRALASALACARARTRTSRPSYIHITCPPRVRATAIPPPPPAHAPPQRPPDVHSPIMR